MRSRLREPCGDEAASSMEMIDASRNATLQPPAHHATRQAPPRRFHVLASGSPFIHLAVMIPSTR